MLGRKSPEAGKDLEGQAASRHRIYEQKIEFWSAI